jgi:hypothetical protein
MTPDSLHAHALGIRLTEEIQPVEQTPAQATGRALDGIEVRTHCGCVDRWLQERDAREQAEKEALDMRKGAEIWCEKAHLHKARAEAWRFAAIMTGLALVGWIAGEWTR